MGPIPTETNLSQANFDLGHVFDFGEKNIFGPTLGGVSVCLCLVCRDWLPLAWNGPLPGTAPLPGPPPLDPPGRPKISFFFSPAPCSLFFLSGGLQKTP